MTETLLQNVPTSSSYGSDDYLLGVQSKTTTPASELYSSSGLGLPDGFMRNGKITPTVASNNLTVTLQTLAGANPSAANSVFAWISGTKRVISSALSVTINAGADTFHSGGPELATQEVDYFPYLRYNATDGVCLGISRIPYACVYSDFSAVATNEKYAAWNVTTNAAAGDVCVNIGRFAATLSGGAGYTWTVPAFTASNLIQRPCFESRVLDYTPVLGASGSMTYTRTAGGIARWKLSREIMLCEVYIIGTTGGTASNSLTITMPFSAKNTVCVGGALFGDPTTKLGGALTGAGSNVASFTKYDNSNFTIGAGEIVTATMHIEI